jgi:hypothetical protein
MVRWIFHRVCSTVLCNKDRTVGLLQANGLLVSGASRQAGRRVLYNAILYFDAGTTKVLASMNDMSGS